MSWRDDYFQRVRPVVGDELTARRLIVWNLAGGYLAAEALARTGLRHQLWLDSGPSDRGAFARSLGLQHAACASRAEALACHCREHNHWETDWELTWDEPTIAVLRDELRRGHVDLLLAEGDESAGDVASAAIEAGVPFVMTFVPARGSAGALQVVWLPDAATDPEAVIRMCGALARLPRLDLDAAEHHVDGLEAHSMALGLAKWILLRQRSPRPDLEQHVVARGECLLIRGEPGWPWTVRWSRLDGSPAPLLAELQGGPARFAPPLGLLGKERWLVLGLGTASLFCAEAALFVPQLVFVDCKAVTPVNPVRQIYGTRDVGQPKPEALARILSRRLDPSASWTPQREGALVQLSAGPWALGYAELRLTSDRESERSFARLLDQVQPTLVIVGMGRSHNDNFTATGELRRRGIRHITPTAFPGVTHFKHILTDGARGPCYDCLQGHLAVDAGSGPTLAPEAREMFYGGSQPATLAETYPSAHSLLRLAVDLALPRGARPPYLLRELAAERCCFVGANRSELTPEGWLFGVDQPFAMVAFGTEDLLRGDVRPCSCGRLNR